MIPGIDTKAALRRAGGSLKRYESLLRKFAHLSADGVEEIRKALAIGDAETAARAAHSIKGSAANLGATAVAEVAAKAESAILSGQGVERGAAFTGDFVCHNRGGNPGGAAERAAGQR